MIRSLETTRVLFPKFEREVPADGDIVNRELVRIAEPRRWIVESELGRLLRPKTGSRANYLDKQERQKNWWGIRHRASVVMPIGMLATEEPESVPFASDPMSLYRYKHIRHSYEWDSQAVIGYGDELVLERLTTSGFKGVLAVLSHPRDREEQLLVRADEAGQWYEPDFVNISRDPERKFYMGMMVSIAGQTLEDIRQETDTLVSGS